jgi:hypothetical protein
MAPFEANILGKISVSDKRQKTDQNVSEVVSRSLLVGKQRTDVDGVVK